MGNLIILLNLAKKYKLAFLISVEILLIYLICILKNVPTSAGYEPSLYAMYPIQFWAIYFAIYLFSLSALIYSIFIRSDRAFFRTSLFNLLILNLIILLMPLFRGYFTIEMGDSSNHLAYIKDILSTHHISDPQGGIADPYPITHILSTITMLFTQIKLEAVGYMTPLLYYFIYVLFTYLLGRELFRNNEKSVLLLSFILVPILHSYRYYPSQSFFFLIPVLLYALVKDTKSMSTPFRYVILILVVTLPFIHPASGALLIILVVIIYVASYFSRAGTPSLGRYVNALFLFLALFVVWIMALDIAFVPWVGYYIKSFANLPAQASVFKANVAGLQRAQLPVIDAIALYIKIYGPMHLSLGMASVFSLCTIVYNWIKKRSDKLNTALSFICLVYVALYIFSLFFTIYLLTARIYTYALLISILVNASFLFYLVNTFKTRIGKTIPVILMIILIFSMTFVATFSLYGSPITRHGTEHGTYMYLNGIDWLLQTRNKDLKMWELDQRQYLYVAYLLGHRKASLEPNLVRISSDERIPWHFNYDNEALLGKTFGEDCYLFVDKKSELMTVNLYPEYEDEWRFHPDDYKKLESDKSIDKIYHNGEIKIFSVNGGEWSEAD